MKPLSKSRKRFAAWILRAGLFLAAGFLTTLLLVAERAPKLGMDEFVVGEPAPRTVFSPFNLAIEDQSETKLQREKKQAEVPLVYVVDRERMDQVFKHIESVFAAAEKIPGKKNKETPEISRIIETLPVELSEPAFLEIVSSKDRKGLKKKTEQFLGRFLSEGIFDEEEKNKLLESGVETVSFVKEGREERLIKVSEFATAHEMQRAVQEALNQKGIKEPELRAYFSDWAQAALVPTVVFSESEFRERREKAVQTVSPVEIKIKKNELIVQRGILISAEQKEKIEEIQKKRVEKKILNQWFSIGVLVFLVYLLTFFYLYQFDPKSLLSFRKAVLILSVYFLTVFLCKVAALWPNAPPILMPLALAPILLMLLSFQRIAFFSAAAMAVFSAPLCGFSAEVMLGGFLSGMAGSFAAMKIRKRVQFLRLGAVVGGVYFCVLFALKVLWEYSWTDSFYSALPGLANGLLITMPLAFLLLPLFENLFGLVTDISLLELSDLNHPILKKMMVEAPGTYHHSLVVSTLAEAACETIGANALLGRVGAYFHDIGKISKSEWFIENQNDRKANPHSGLSPEMSARLIREHIRDGVELGRRHKLKERILQFVREHQGTALISYFYQKAMENASPGARVDLSDFRYDGPKPQSRETAVVLLADAVEAASRSLDHPTPESVRSLVKRLINDRFMDGQFDECDLSLKDLKKIEKSFEHNLMAILHTRLRYPNMPGTEEGIDLFEKKKPVFNIEKSHKKK